MMSVDQSDAAEVKPVRKVICESYYEQGLKSLFSLRAKKRKQKQIAVSEDKPGGTIWEKPFGRGTGEGSPRQAKYKERWKECHERD